MTKVTRMQVELIAVCVSTSLVTALLSEDADEFIVLASDGVWEFIDNQTAVDIIVNAKKPQLAVDTLTKESKERWNQEEEVVDDITAVIAYFKPPATSSE